MEDEKKSVARKELEGLLAKAKDASGIFKDGYLFDAEGVGRRILELVRTELNLSWPDILALLKRSKTTIEKAFSHYDIGKKRAKHTNWTPERIALAEKYFKKSVDLHSRWESVTLRAEMVRDVSALPGEKVSLNAIRLMARDYDWGKWGWSTNSEENTVKAAEKTLLKSMEVRIAELVHQGALISLGVDALYEQVKGEFAEKLRATPVAFNKRSFQAKIVKLVWTKDVDKSLQEVVRMRFKIEEKFCPLFPHIPLDMVKLRERWHKGVIKAKVVPEEAQPGIGRIRARKELGDLTTFKMPQTDFKNPFVAGVKITAQGNFSLMFLNGANMGTRHGGDIVGNVVRRALSDADTRGDAAIVATNIVSLDLKKAGGPRKIGRALVMGDNVNPNVFADPVYRKDVERIIRDKPLDEIVYQTAEELLHNILSGWHKVCIKPNKKPEYAGRVYIVFGINEEELAKAIAYWEIRYFTMLKQLELKAETQIIAAALKRAEENEDTKLANRLAKELAVVQERYNRTTITTVATQEAQRFYEHARALVAREIELAIPNSRVIGQGTTYLEIGGEKIEISIPSHERVTDSLLKDYTLNYAPKILRGGLAPTVVICGPWALQFRTTVREADYDGKRGSAKVFVAPIVVDGAYLRGVLADVIKQEHPLARAVSSGQFQPGVLRLRRTNGIIDADIISATALEAHERYPQVRAAKKNGSEEKCVSSLYCRGPKYLWVHTATDQHWGGRAKEFLTEKGSGRRLGVAEAVFHMMRREGLCEGMAMPVHLFSSNDDPTQGQNFKARTQPDPHELSPHEIERQMLALLERGKQTEKPGELRSLQAEMLRLSSYQIEKRGADFVLHQMKQMLERHIAANVDIFSAILRRARKAGLALRGVGEFGNAAHGGYDTRNVGVLNFGGGNHFEHTLEGELIEGPFYADHLRLLLAALPEWRDNGEFLSRAVVSPHYSGQAMAWGTMRVGTGYEYGLDLRDTPPRMSGWGDPLYGAVKNDPQRGNYSRIFNGRMTLKTYGDKHFFAAVATPYAFYHMCAAGTHTDRYGERGFPPNNTGVSFVGLPVDGPDSGPILLRILPFDVIKDFVEDNPRPFDWDSFLPNPA